MEGRRRIIYIVVMLTVGRLATMRGRKMKNYICIYIVVLTGGRLATMSEIKMTHIYCCVVLFDHLVKREGVAVDISA